MTTTRWLVVCLLAVDGFFIAVGLATSPGWLDSLGLGRLSRELALGPEKSLPSLFLLGKWTATATLLWFLHAVRGVRIHAFWAAVVSYLIADDLLEMHERVGRLLAGGGATGLRLQLAESVLTLIVGVIVLYALWRSHRRPLSEDVRRFSHRLVAVMVALLVVGVAFDLLHTLGAGPSRDLAGLLEDGGELVVGTFLLVLVWYYAVRTVRSPTETS